MKLLALDASTQALSVALLDDRAAHDDVLEHFEIAPRAHATTLLPVAQQLLATAQWQLADLDGFAFGRGPGAFTGLRIAAGLIQGLAYGLDRPVAPVSTLAALAQRAFDRHAGDRARVVQDARMGEVYVAEFRRDAQGATAGDGAERVIEPSRIARDSGGWLRAGNGWGLVAEALGQDAATYEVCETWPHAEDIARLGAACLRRGEGVAAAAALPVYVRDDVARKVQ